MADAKVCAACGAKVRHDRARCLRCGQPLVDASEVRAQRSRTLAWMLPLVAVTGAAALVGVVATRPTASAVVEAPKPEPKRMSQQAPEAPAIPAVAASIDGRRRGEAEYAKGDIEGAITSFQRAVDVEPNDPVAQNNLGQALVRAGRPTEAIPHFDRAIEMDPERWAYHFNRARAYGAMQEWSRAIAGYQAALRLFPDDYATQYNLAKALQQSGDLTGAIAGFERAIQLAPGEADFHLSHGLALEAAKRPKDAAAAYRRYLELAGSTSDADAVKSRISALEGASAATP